MTNTARAHGIRERCRSPMSAAAYDILALAEGEIPRPWAGGAPQSRETRATLGCAADHPVHRGAHWRHLRRHHLDGDLPRVWVRPHRAFLAATSMHPAASRAVENVRQRQADDFAPADCMMRTQTGGLDNSRLEPLELGASQGVAYGLTWMALNSDCAGSLQSVQTKCHDRQMSRPTDGSRFLHQWYRVRLLGRQAWSVQERSDMRRQGSLRMSTEARKRTMSGLPK